MGDTMRIATLLVAGLLLGAAKELPKKVTIFVSPPTRDGYIDTDKGIRDSIKDLKDQLRGSRRLQLVQTKESAQLVLEVVGRGRTSNGGGGAAAVPLGNSTFFLPLETIGLTTVLRVGDYDKPLIFDKCGEWTHCAQLVVKDVEAWVEENADALRARADK
jgi:hypothetical protein